MKKIAFTLSLVLVLALSSCKKNDDTIVPATPRANSISELKTSPEFNWSTVKNINLSVDAIQTYVTVKRKLVIKDQNGVEYFSVFHSMNNSINITIQLPSHINKVTIEYGQIIKTISISGNTIRFDFTPGITNEEL